VVLRGRNLGEADRILTLFTLERGKVDSVAKGIRRARSKLSGRLEFGNEVLMTLHRGRSLDVIQSAEIASERWRALVEPERFAVASMACELVDAFCEPDLALPEVYELLVGMLAAVAASNQPRALAPRFSMRLLDALGLAPPLDTCIQCGNPIEGGRAWVDAQAGGLVDEACRERWRDLPELNAGELRNLQSIAAAKSGAGRATAHATPSVAEAVELFVAHHLGRKPKSMTAVLGGAR
jgi:DNA repair protein RecO (recombination protein O)